MIGVIEPGAEAARRASTTGDVLVIATDATVQSHAYAEACRTRGLHALEKACPLLVPLVEEGWLTLSIRNEAGAAHAASAPPLVAQVAVTAEVFRIYFEELSTEAAAKGLTPDTLVLGCTHYPLLKPLIERVIPSGMKIIDSAESTADKLVMYLCRDLGAPPEPTPADPVLRFFATDSVEKFERLGSRFLGRPVSNVQLVDLGG